MKILANSKFNKSIVVLKDIRHTLARRKSNNLQVLNILASIPSENTFKNSFKKWIWKAHSPMDHSLPGGYTTIPVESLVNYRFLISWISPWLLHRSQFTRRLRHYPSGIACNCRHHAPRITPAYIINSHDPNTMIHRVGFQSQWTFH